MDGATILALIASAAAIGAAVIAAIAAFLVGYFGAKWTAEGELVQWQRDELMRFSADLVAASGEIVDWGQSLQDNPLLPYPGESVSRLRHAQSCILMLSDRLAPSSKEYFEATMGIILEGPVVSDNLAEATPAATRTAKASGLFLRAAHDLIHSVPQRPNLWQRVESTMREAVVGVGLVAPPPPK